MLAEAERLRSAPLRYTPPELSRLILDGVDLARGLLPESDPRLADLEHAYQMARGMSRLGIQRLEWDASAELVDAAFALLAERSLEVASHAGPTSSLRGRSSVDWMQVSRGLLDNGENTVAWQITTGPTPDIQVAVIAGPLASRNRPLAFRALRLDGSIAALGSLTFDPREGEYGGSANLTPEEASPLVVDVFDPWLVKPARVGAAAIAAEAMRWAARAITLVRLARGARDPSRVVEALDLLQRSSRLYRASADAAPPGWSAGLQACQIQALDYLQAAAADSGRDSVRLRTVQTMSRLGHSPRYALTDEPLTAAELALLVGQSGR
jgi:hypothetical protein